MSGDTVNKRHIPAGVQALACQWMEPEIQGKL